MQQVLKFKIEIFDVRMRTSILVINDTTLVRSIQINKGTTLDNVATIVFQKSKTYENLPMENILKLYNYVKIELELRNYNPTNVVDGKGEFFYFSGFIQTINKASQFGSTPASAVTITISDYANLMKTTFYTKNLTFLEILNQAVPEFRLLNFSEYLGDKRNQLLNSFYSPTQMGFIFFAFMFFKFMYRIVYDQDGQTKKVVAPDSREIFKKFKIYMPFGFPISTEALSTDTGESSINTSNSMLQGQETSLEIYKQLQGVALDLFKYLYPEPIFEFTTYETEDSVILMIRLTPLMKFDRPTITSTISTGFADPFWYEGGKSKFVEAKTAETQHYSFDFNSYNVIEYKDFGHERIRSIRQNQGVSPAAMLRTHLDDKNILSMLGENLDELRHMKVDDLIANDRESDKITDLFFNVIKIDTKYLESINLTRSASSVVNVIWTVPTTDTAVLKMSGRELVYSYLQQRLMEVGGVDEFGNYVYQQFNPGFNANPVFLMDYRNVFGQDFVSGDMNFFGFREFEVKWNYLSVEYSTIGHILKYVDTATLAKAKAACADSKVVNVLDDALRASANVTQQTTSKKNKPRDQKLLFDAYTSITSPLSKTSILYDPLIKYKPPTDFKQSIIQSLRTAKPSKSKKLDIKAALDDDNFKKAMKRYGLSTEDLKREEKIVELVLRAKKEDTYLMGGFVSELNSVIASAYRENEHLYECQLLKPIDVKVLPGMIVESDNESIKAQSPKFKGYVTSISHIIDFNAASMKSTITLSRAAADDSAVITTLNSEN